MADKLVRYTSSLVKAIKLSNDSVKDKSLWESVLQEILLDFRSFSFENILTILTSFNKSPVKDKELYRRAAEIYVKNVRRMDPSNIKLVVNCYANANFFDDKLLSEISCHVLKNISYFDVNALTTIVNGCCRLEYRNDLFYENIAVELIQKYRNMNGLDVACVTYAYGRLIHGNRHKLSCSHAYYLLFEKCYSLVEEDSEILKNLSIGNAAIILNAFAKVNMCHPKLFRIVSTHVCKLLDVEQQQYDDVHHLSLILNSYAKCLIYKNRLFNQICIILNNKVNLLSPTNIANVVHALAKFDYYDPILMETISSKILETLVQFPQRELCNVIWGFAKLHVKNDEFYKSVFAQVSDALRRLKWTHSGELLSDLLEVFLLKISDSSVHCTTQVAWSFLKLGNIDKHENFMRTVLQRLRFLKQEMTITNLTFTYRLIRSYKETYEDEYNLQPKHIKQFCAEILKAVKEFNVSQDK